LCSKGVAIIGREAETEGNILSIIFFLPDSLTYN